MINEFLARGTTIESTKINEPYEIDDWLHRSGGSLKCVSPFETCDRWSTIKSGKR